MQCTRCFNGIWWIAVLLVFLAFTVPATAQSDVLGNAIVAYPIQDYLSWSTSNEIPWSIDFNEGYNDTSSLKSGPIECAGSSRIMMKIQGPATIRFEWKIDGPSGIGQLLFKVDNNKTFECPSRTWTEFNYALSAGATHEVEWCFRKIRSYPSWGGAGWVDDIKTIQIAQCIKNISNKSNTLNISNAQANNSSSCNLTMTNCSSDTNASHGNDSTNTYDSISIQPFYPKDFAKKSMDNPLKFIFIPKSKNKIYNCTLNIDGDDKNPSFQIKANTQNELEADMSSANEGIHRWKVKCCECGGSACNSSETAYFVLSKSNDTTYVDQNHPDESNFTYKDIPSAISRTDDGGRVIIEPGNYTKSFVIERPITIIGRNWPLLSFSNAEGIRINSDNVNISGLNMDGWAGGMCTEFIIENRKNICILNNRINKSHIAIDADGCVDCNISNNNLSEFRYRDSYGIELTNCSNCIIDSNIINDNNLSVRSLIERCISLDTFGNNIYKDNVFGHSDFGVYVRTLRGMKEEDIKKKLADDRNRLTKGCSNILGVKNQ